MSNNTVTEQQIADIIAASEFQWVVVEPKTLVMVATLPNGFVIVEDASCVDPVNFDVEIGKDICLNRLENKIWELEGYKLQSKVAGE